MAQPQQKEQHDMLKTISPVDGSVYVERPLQGPADIDAALDKAKKAQKEWRKAPLAERQKYILKFMDYMVAHADEIGKEITWQMGRPVSQTPGEIMRGFVERIKYTVELAPKALADIIPDDRQEGFKRYIRREPVGVVAIIAPWNYPYLTSVNAIVPALLAGNAVILKHSHQTPLVADRYAEGFKAAGLPDGVFQFLDLSHADAEKLMADKRVDFVNFTGSVKGGHAVQKAICDKFIVAGLELGGKDPAYVRADADVHYAVENLVDGAFFNSGQCCCGIERIYVHESVYDAFVKEFVELTKKYKLGNPTEPETNLGPMVRTAAADFVRGQIDEAVKKGAKALIDESLFPASKPGTPYLAPQVLVDVDHSMSIMMDETFGPAVGIMKVKDDAEAVKLMNDSPFGLTASIWTKDAEAAEKLGQEVETGTVYLNRCDYLDPGLPWTGVKDTGRGASLSIVGFESLTRPKSFHLKTKI
ncbi:MAG: aldehyde dehydrogenase family protein [Alphaproteobacteria bacterium]|nr:aldehyde dehydrogenase family protein [Alphaproteobacteria bacterium]